MEKEKSSVSLDQLQKVGNVFVINRSTPFDPVSLLGAGDSFWRGPKNGKGLKGDIEQDARSLAISEIDLNEIQFKSYIPDGESAITGGARLDAIRKIPNDIPLDPKIGQDLYDEPGQKGLRSLYDRTGITWMEFLGQTLRSSVDDRYSLVLFRFVDGGWARYSYWLGRDRHVSSLAAVVSKLAR